MNLNKLLSSNSSFNNTYTAIGGGAGGYPYFMGSGTRQGGTSDRQAELDREIIPLP